MGSIKSYRYTVLFCLTLACCYMYIGFPSGIPTAIIMKQLLSWKNWIYGKETRSQKTMFAVDDLDLKYSNREELQKIGDIVQRRLLHIQNPVSCNTRRKIHCQLHKCGVGCTVNTMSNCLMLAYALNRTVILSRQYADQLKSVSSTCLDLEGGNSTRFGKDHEQNQVVRFCLLENDYKPEFYPPALPDDLFGRIRRYHDDPFLWWAGQISSYVFRLANVTYMKFIRDTNLKDFEKPIVGVHVRRTDKRSEAKLYEVDEYMVHVERWFRTRAILKPKIFLATDEPSVLEEISKR